MEYVKPTRSEKQIYEHTGNEFEDFDAFVNIMVQLIEKYGKLVLQELDYVA